ASRVGIVAAALALLAGGAYFQANRAEQKARQRLVRQYVDKGAQLMNSGDPSGALPWFVEAMKLDKGDPVRESIHRMRIGACSQDAPRPVHVWFHQRRVGYAEFSRDGLRVVTASDDGTACVWDTKTGELIAK